MKPLCHARLDALSFKTALLLALGVCQAHRLARHPSCLMVKPFCMADTKPMFLPKNIGSYLRSKEFVPKGFHFPLYVSETEDASAVPGLGIGIYFQCSAGFMSTQQVFMCCSDAARCRTH